MPRLCIYCDKEKEDSEFSLEHVIPQFLGGAYSDDIFKTRDVCRSCNSTLGLNVDASFEKAWMISAWLQQSSMACFDPITATHPIPLMCMGNATLSPPAMTNSELCEAYLGPLGESVYWVRPKDEERYWYVGGNPITTKSQETRAYFFFSTRTVKAPAITMAAFKNAFKDRKKVKKILCGEITGANPVEFGFQEPDELDAARISYFWQQQKSRGVGHTQIEFNAGFDKRFISKLALGIGYCLLGKDFLNSIYATELRKGIWFREWLDSNVESPEIYAGSSIMQTSSILPEHLLEEWAVTIIIMPTPVGLAINLNLGFSHGWTLLGADAQTLSQDVIQKIEGGLVLVLYKSLQKGVLMRLHEYINYKLEHSTHPLLSPISHTIQSNKTYFKNL